MLDLQEYNTSDENKTMSGNFGDVSHEVLSKIEGQGYFQSKAMLNEYLRINPFAANKKFVNL